MSDTALAIPAELLDVKTGEVLPATVENAAVVLRAARLMKDDIDMVVHAATAYLAAEAARVGTKTFHTEAATVTLTGGESVDYDADELMAALRQVECPEERINEAVAATVSYRVNRSVLRQLAGANPTYRAAIAGCERTVEKPMRASVR